MASIEEVRAGIARRTTRPRRASAPCSRPSPRWRQAQGELPRVTEGSGQADVSEANSLLAQAVTSVTEVQQSVQAAIQASEGVANRL